MPAVIIYSLALTLLFAGSWHAGAQTVGFPQVAGAAADGSIGGLAEQTSQRSLTPPSVLNGRATRIAHYDPTKVLRLAIVLAPPHLAEERQFLNDVQNKQSPLFHQYLTTEQWRDQFGPAAEDEQAVADWAASQGMTITQRYPNRLLVDVEAPAGTIEKALNITINTYQLPGSDPSDPLSFRYSNDREPTLPSRLAGVVHSIQGLNSFEAVRPGGGTGRLVARPDYVPGPASAVKESRQQDATTLAAPPNAAAVQGAEIAGAPGAENTEITPPGSGYFTPDIMFSSPEYDYGALMAQGHCCNPLNNPTTYTPRETSIAIAAFGSVSLTDIADFQSYFSYLAYNVETINIDGGYTCNNSNGYDGNCAEATMDTEWSLAMANSEGSSAATAKVYVYEGANYNDSTVIDLYNQMLSDAHARTMSTSWDCGENTSDSSQSNCLNATMEARDYVLSEMAGEGWTLVAAAGDQGATGKCSDALAVEFPASDPNVIAAGGTELNAFAGATGNAYEVAWTGDTTSDACGSNGGGGTGGFSEYFGVPSYQSGMGFSSRAVPDLSLDAFYGHDVWYDGVWAHEAGTSVVAPMLAGFFAQENAYLLAIGDKCGSSGTSACAPLGNANYPIYEEGRDHNAGRLPFYDIVEGCNDNYLTITYNLNAYCAGPGYDEATGWGSANMLQLAWAINWETTTANGVPYVSFSGPATNTWYNTNQTVNWTVVDYTGGSPSSTGTGIAGETQGWDSVPADPTSEPHGGSGNSFYSGPQFINDSTGCLAFSDNGCSGNNGAQGCHTVHVEGWNNQGMSTGDSTYGPLCYDNVAPAIGVAFSQSVPASGWYTNSVGVTLTVADPGGANASGISKLYYAIDNTSCSTSNTGACDYVSSSSLSLTITAQAKNTITAFAKDNAGNFSSVATNEVNIEEAAPATKVGFSGLLIGNDWESAVTVVLTATDTLSGVKATYYSLNGGPFKQYSTPFVVSTVGSDTIDFYSVNVAGITETTNSDSLTILSPTRTTLTAAPNPATPGTGVSLKAVVAATVSGTPTGTVTFKNGTSIIGTATLSAGVATLATSTLPAGSDSLTAIYGGVTNYLASTSAPLMQIVGEPNVPAFSLSTGTFTTPQTVYITATSANSVIWFTTDGTTPVPGQGTALQYYLRGVPINQTTTLKAVATVAGWGTSSATSAIYTLDVPAPTFGLAPGTYETTQTVSINDVAPNAAIWYTTDGTAPVPGVGTAVQYGGTAVPINHSTVLKAVATVSGWKTSSAASATYTLAATAPAFSLQSGTYLTAQNVTMNDVTPNAVIWYTTDGTAPVPGQGTAVQYGGTAVPINQSTVLKAVAAVSGWKTSTATSAVYTINGIYHQP
ncbi:MAG: chitobiase/beta-hexosaminidase C-terminal domain-containing protein [Terracidiphilus sp.]